MTVGSQEIIQLDDKHNNLTNTTTLYRAINRFAYICSQTNVHKCLQMFTGIKTSYTSLFPGPAPLSSSWVAQSTAFTRSAASQTRTWVTDRG